MKHSVILRRQCFLPNGRETLWEGHQGQGRKPARAEASDRHADNLSVTSDAIIGEVRGQAHIEVVGE